jgi:hypothetical protein
MPVITLMKKKKETNPKRHKLSLTKYKKLTSQVHHKDKRQDECNNI